MDAVKKNEAWLWANRGAILDRVVRGGDIYFRENWPGSSGSLPNIFNLTLFFKFELLETPVLQVHSLISGAYLIRQIGELISQKN